MKGEMLYKKYRPQMFEDFFGNRNIVEVIKNSLVEKKMAHAYLFSGPRGTGKTSLARLIVKSLNCEKLRDGYNPCNECSNCIAIAKNRFADMKELDAASNRGIDEIRAIKDSVNYKPLMSKYKVYIIDEVHMLTKEAFNAILKTLEEPPAHVLFILATTESDKILDTIKSRCQRFEFKLIEPLSIVERIEGILKLEDRSLDRDAIDLVVEESGFSMRDALSILEKVLCSSSKNVSLKDAESSLGLTPSTVIASLYDLYKKADIDEISNLIDSSWRDGFKIDMMLRQFAFKLRKEKESIYHIAEIYKVLNEFRWEENKRAIAYILFSNIIEKIESKEKVVKEKKPSKVETAKEIKEKKKTIEVKTVDVVEEKTEEVKEPILKESTNAEESPKSSGDELSVIKSNWKEIVEKAKSKSIALMVFLISANLDSFADGVLNISYDEKHKFHKESISKSENKLMLESAIYDVTKINLKVSFSLKDAPIQDANFKKNVEDLFSL